MKPNEKIKVGDILKAKITGITDYGIFVSIYNYDGLVHISEVSDKFIPDLNLLYKVGQTITVKVLKINKKKRKLSLTIKQIDFKNNKNISKIPESGTGFKKLKDNLPIWIKEKMQLLTKIK